ncbi:MAG: M48 family metallopeptidase [Bacteroidota bacterium]|nr:M48 family metallopeptidase [Bacteroidota bacterium]
MKTFEANYYSGIKPIGRKVRVFLEQESIRIQSITSETIPVDITWVIQKIQPDEFKDQHKLILNYGRSGSNQFLEITDQALIEELSIRYSGARFLKPKKNSFRRFSIAGLLVISAIIICGLVGLYFVLNPWISSKFADTLPISWEEKLGEASFAQLVTSTDVDSVQTTYLQEFYDSLYFESKYNISVYFVKDSMVNAFALPGGRMVVFDGIMSKMNSYEELAGLLGHEFTHIDKRHSLKAIFQNLSSYIILSMIFGDITGLAGIIIENAHMINNLGYSRKFEKEADLNAFELLTQREINPQGLIRLFEILQNEVKTEDHVPRFLNSHPMTEERIKYLNERITNQQSNYKDHAGLIRLFHLIKSGESCY